MILRIYILASLILLTFQGSAQSPQPGFTDKISVNDKRSVYLKSVFTESANSATFDLVYQRMNWAVNPNNRYISGNITSYFKSNAIQLDSIEFDLEKSMVIDSVVQNSIGRNFSRRENKFAVKLGNSLQSNEIDSFTVFYRGTPTNSGFGSFTVSKQSTNKNNPILWTLSEPYGAMEWWPCKQSLTDKIDSVDIIVTSPEAYRTASNGILVSENVANGFRTMHWKHRFPIATYLVAIAVTNYVNYSDFLTLEDGRKLEVQNFVYPEYYEIAKNSTPVTTEIIALYNHLIGEYPFSREKYGHAQFGWGGGMEHQTISFMNNFNFELVAHELAHQWFGDYITLGSWHDIWLNEGFATYMSGLAYENLLGGKWWPQFKKVNLDNITQLPGGSVYVKDTSNINLLFNGRLSYSKGAFLLHMLRWILGDQKFFKGMKDYFNDPEIANGFASNQQFINHMEIAGDTILTEFFNDWYYGEGFPVYSAKFIQNVSNNLKITLSQTPSHTSVSFFEMPVPVRVYSTERKDSADFRLLNTKNNQEFIVKPGFNVSELKIDPEIWLISKTSEVVGIHEIDNKKTVRIYPNPFTGFINLDIPENMNVILINLFDETGREIYRFNPFIHKLNLADLKSGCYILQIQTQNGILNQRIVKH